MGNKVYTSQAGLYIGMYDSLKYTFIAPVTRWNDWNEKYHGWCIPNEVVLDLEKRGCQYILLLDGENNWEYKIDLFDFLDHGVIYGPKTREMVVCPHNYFKRSINL